MEEFIILCKPLIKNWKIVVASTVFAALLSILLTKNISRMYESSATIYTGLTTGDGIVQQQYARVDEKFFSPYDNMAVIVTSRETLKEVGLKIFAMHMTFKKTYPNIEYNETIEELLNRVPQDIKQLVGETDSITYHNLNAVADDHNFLVGLINYPVPYYSTTALSSIKVTRMSKSDMIKMSYSSNEPGLSQRTLEIFIDVCIRNYRRIKEGQIDKKVDYYEEQLHLAKEKLRLAEHKEETFKRAYGVANLSIQTEFAISNTQQINTLIQNEQQFLSQTYAGIQQIEGKLDSPENSEKRTQIMLKREELGVLNKQLSNAQLYNEPASRIAELEGQIEKVKTELSAATAAVTSPTTSGKTVDLAATEYFNRIVAYEESKARIKSLEDRRDLAAGQFSRMLPLEDTLRRIQREIDISEKEYHIALENMNKSRIEQQNQRSFSTIEVIDKPNFPLRAKSKRKMLILLGTMIGFAIPSSIFLGLDYLNKNIQTPKRAEEIIGLTLAGIMPNTKKLQTLKNYELIVDGLNDTILKNLYLTNYKSNQMRILIISTRPKEGKTIISNSLCERLIKKGRNPLVVQPYVDSGSWSMVSYRVDNSFYQARAEDIVPIERINDADILIIELPSLIMNDYPVELIRQFDMAFLICMANREWVKADQTALDSFVKISGIKPQIILNDVELEVIDEILGKIS